MKTTEQIIASNFEKFMLVAESHKFGQLEKMNLKGMRSRSNKISKEVWIKWITNIVNFQGETAEDVINYLARTDERFRELFLNIHGQDGKKFLEVFYIF